MGWSFLAGQFCLELGLGLLIALGFVSRAPLGRFFYRLMGCTALLPILVASSAPVLLGIAPVSEPAVWCAGLALLALPWIGAGRVGRAWELARLWAVSWCVMSLALHLARSTDLERLPAMALATASAVATGLVAGSVSLAMVLGHWYLTVPKLGIEHLERLNRVTVISMVLSATLLVASCFAFGDTLGTADTPLTSPRGLAYLGTRVTVGLLLPLLFAWMTADSLRFSNTRSATGILYASTVLVLIGTAASVSLQDSYGIPL